MHYFIFVSYNVETDADITFFVDNLLGGVFDIYVILCVLWIVTLKRTKATLILWYYLQQTLLYMLPFVPSTLN